MVFSMGSDLQKIYNKSSIWNWYYANVTTAIFLKYESFCNYGDKNKNNVV